MSLSTADRIALADLVNRYPAYVDQKKHALTADLFTIDALLVLPAPPENLGPTLIRKGRAEILAGLMALDSRMLTLHANVGQVVDAADEPDTATGRVACIAHHLTHRDSGVSNRVWHLHYDDRYQKFNGQWLFARRNLQIDWIETRPVRRWRLTQEEGQG